MPLCFAIMPISTPPQLLGVYGEDEQHFIRVSQHIFRPAAEAAGFEFRAPTMLNAEIIQADIIKNLEQADLVLCDISTWNANVFFELGIRVALDRPVAMVKDSLTGHIPFDNAMVNCHTYDPVMEIWRVEEELPKLQRFIEGAKTQTQNALWKFFGITQRAERTSPSSPEDAKLELLLSEVSLLRREAADARRSSTATPVRQLAPGAGRLSDAVDGVSAKMLGLLTVDVRARKSPALRDSEVSYVQGRVTISLAREPDQLDLQHIVDVASQQLPPSTFITVDSPHENRKYQLPDSTANE